MPGTSEKAEVKENEPVAFDTTDFDGGPIKLAVR
jgi:hypothetical protein